MSKLTPSSDDVMRYGNVLGSPKAETDKEMLSKAFIQTADYVALAQTTSFHFVVGRRGTGKSAIYQQLIQHQVKEGNRILISGTPCEHQMLHFHALLERCGQKYTSLRPISRLVWKVHILFSVLKALKHSYKLQSSSEFTFLNDYEMRHKDLFKIDGFERCSCILEEGQGASVDCKMIPALLAKYFIVEKLQKSISSALRDIKKSVYVIYDGLDEGWTPSEVATANLGGLAMAASDFAENQSEIHCLLFVRDNMFRSLAYLDDDFSRNIEGFTLRLRWEKDSLLQLVAGRLRVFYSISVESHLKAWNRFAHKKLANREGFHYCLKYTLYRPRDILVLLNKAYVNASKSGRGEIVEEDIEAAAKQISIDRLNDTLKEYDRVFPGLRLFINSFQGKPAYETYGNIVLALDKAINDEKYNVSEARDFALMADGRQIFDALYSIGFLGLEDFSAGSYRFCHDGSNSDHASVDVSHRTLVHPCFWKALEMQNDQQHLSDLQFLIDDDYKAKSFDDLKDARTKLIGRAVAQISNIPMGKEGSADFEKWTLMAIKILFAGKLQNPELKPNGQAVMQRDIVATNMAQTGFWRRVYEDYESRQIIFEAKNYAELKSDDFYQVNSYLTGNYGRFCVIVTRSPNEGLSDNEKGWTKEMWDQHKKIIFIIPSVVLCRSMAKLRNIDRKNDYVDDQLNKKMDQYSRAVLPFRRK